MFCIIQWKMRRSHSGSKKAESVTNCHGRSCYLLVLKYPFKPLLRPAQPANVTASVPVTNTISLSLPIMPGIHQDYVTHTSDSVRRQKVASGYSFVPESDVECSTWLANAMSDDRCTMCILLPTHVVHCYQCLLCWAPARLSFTCSSSTGWVKVVGGSHILQ